MPFFVRPVLCPFKWISCQCSFNCYSIADVLANGAGVAYSCLLVWSTLFVPFSEGIQGHQFLTVRNK